MQETWYSLKIILYVRSFILPIFVDISLFRFMPHSYEFSVRFFIILLLNNLWLILINVDNDKTGFIDEPDWRLGHVFYLVVLIEAGLSTFFDSFSENEKIIFWRELSGFFDCLKSWEGKFNGFSLENWRFSITFWQKGVEGLR